MIIPRRPCHNSRKSRYFHTAGFTLVESLLTMLILGLMLYVSVGTLEPLRCTTRLTAAQQLISALEEARSDAMSSSSPSILLFRQKLDDLGRMTCREFGLLQRKAGMNAIVWRQLPVGVVLWTGQSEQVTSGTDLFSLPPQTPVQRGFIGLGNEGNEPHIALVFGDLGEVIFPTAQPLTPEATPTPGPYYLCVAETTQSLGSQTPKNMQLIEIRPSTGRAQLLP